MWSIEPLLLARCAVPGPEVFFQRDFDRRVELAIYAFVLRNGAHTILVDTGLPEEHSRLNRDIQARKGSWSGFREAGPRIEERLAERNLIPDLVVLTSFGPYALGGLPRLPSAPLWMSARGLRDLREPEVAAIVHPPPKDVTEILLSGRGHQVEGEATPMPGVILVEAGVHHPASMAVLVDTIDGRIGIVDPIFHRENLTRGLALGAAEHLAGWHPMTRSLSLRIDRCLPIHDPDPTPVPRALWDPRLVAEGSPP